jgi:pimeloyl-ACP methyl ester carboxylesterase
VIAPDLPGFGNSTYLENVSYNIDEQAKRLNQFADAMDLQMFHIVGNSMGGYIAGRYAVMFPEKVITLGLFNTAGVRSPVPSEWDQIMSRGEPNPLILTTGSVEEFDMQLNFLFSTPPDIPRFFKKQIVKDFQNHRASNERIFKQILSELYGLEPDLPKIKDRALVLWGDQDRVIDVSRVLVLKDGLPNSIAVIMKDCGHVPMLERPEEAAEHYLTFLKNK